nr:unnamed protein product [Leishmania braziliensis]
MSATPRRCRRPRCGGWGSRRAAFCRLRARARRAGEDRADEQIARSPFTRTWALYQRVAAPEETLAPRAAPPAPLQDSESFASLDVEEPPAVLRREGTPEVATMVAHEARAPALQRVGTPEEPRVGLVATTHRVRLDGDAWARVLEACPDLLKQEFTSDVCDATSLPPTSMRRLVLAAGSLVADFELAHGGLARTELVSRSPAPPSPARGRCTSASLRRKRRWPPRCAAWRTPGSLSDVPAEAGCRGRGAGGAATTWRTRHGRQRCSASAHPRSRAWAWWPRRTGCVWTATPGRASLRRARTCSSGSSPAMSATPRRCRRPRCGGWCSRRAALLPTSSSRTAGWRGPSVMSRSPAPPSPARGRCTSASLRRKRRWAPRCAACRPSGLRELRVTGRRGAAGCAAAGGDAGGGDHGGARGTGASAAARRHTRGAARGLGGHDAPGASGRRRLGARP